MWVLYPERLDFRRLLGSGLKAAANPAYYPDQIGIWNIGSQEGGKLESPEKKTFGARREPITNSTYIWHQAKIKSRLHWREASTLTTANVITTALTHHEGPH